jgi:hypothetical protein
MPSAEEVLRRTLPVLLEEDADFKVAASSGRLAGLNEGQGGLSQIGKFITVYPNEDAQAVRLAQALDEATRGLLGPVIPSDRPLAPRSAVHYRYGGFGELHLQTPLGEIVPAIRAPDETLVPDRRLPAYQAPPWAVDPFMAAGVAEDLPAPTRRIGARYVILATLHRSPRSTVYLCLDIEIPRRCVLKKVSDDGHYAHERLRHEADVLARLAPDPRFPEFYALFEHDGDLILSMEDIEGETFEQYLGTRRATGRPPCSEEVIAWGRELAAMLADIHDKGFIFRDLKSSNVVVAPDGRLRLLDFELAHERASSVCPHGRGTRGYMSPQLQRGDPPTEADDVYALGALLYLAATGAEPSRAPNPMTLLERPVELLNPETGPALAQVIGCCLEPNVARRFATMPEVEVALAKASSATPEWSALFGEESPLESEATARRRATRRARRLGDALCAAAPWISDGETPERMQSNPVSDAFPSVDINIGYGGAVLALAELVAAFDDPTHRAVLADYAHWLTSAPRPGGPPHPGLYVGESGVGAAQLRAGQILGDDALIGAALERGRWIATLPFSSPDLFNGTAGRLRFHLWLWDDTADAEQLGHAVVAGEQLLTTAETVEGGGLRWRIPAGYGGLSDQALLGYAHGAAGIGDALLDLFEVTGDLRILAAAQGAGRWLMDLAVPALSDESGLNWPANENEDAPMAFWCHGATGVGRFLLHLGQLERDASSTAMHAAERAARTATRGARWAGPTQCHGLAGNIEFALDMYQSTGDARYLREARSLGRLLETFAVEANGVVSWATDPSESPQPGLVVGDAGVAVCLLRLAHPETWPHLLSRRGFLFRAPFKTG